MKADTPKTRSPSSDQEFSPSNFCATNMPTPIRSGLLIPNNLFPQYASVAAIDPSISLSTSSSTLAARRLVSRPNQIKPRSLQYDHEAYGQSPTPPMEILSPTIIAARDYYLNLNYHYQLDTPPYSGSEAGTPKINIHPTLRTITQSSNVPRRHSVALEPYTRSFGGMVDLKMQAPDASRRGSAMSSPQDFKDSSCIGSNGNREMLMHQAFKDDVDIESSSFLLQPLCAENLDDSLETERQIHNPLDPRYLGNIPFSYTTNKLREWGSIYLFNSATADAFIRAVAIPSSASSSIRSSTSSTSSSDLYRAMSKISLSPNSVNEEDLELEIAKKLVRVRVVPYCRTKKPFYIQKHFPIRKSDLYRVGKHSTSPRYHQRHHHEHYQGTKVEELKDKIAVEAEKRRAIPIR